MSDPTEPDNRTAPASPISLSLPVDEIERDIDAQTPDPGQQQASEPEPEDPELAATADTFVADVLAMDDAQAAAAHAKREAVDGMGAEVRR